MKKYMIKFYSFCVIMLLVSVFILVFPKTVNRTVAFTVKFCLESMIPSLFPFLVLSQLFAESNLQNTLGKYFAKPIENIYGVCENLSGSFLIGLISGFPSGARAVCIAYDKKLCTKEQAEYAVAVSNNASPVFILSVVGVVSLGKFASGIILLFAQLIALSFTSVILRKIEFGGEKECPYKITPIKTERLPVSQIIVKSVKDSVFVMLIICGFIVFFSVISLFFQTISVLLFGHSIWLKSIISGFFEISSGIFTAGTITNHRGMLLCAAMMGWSGLSVYFQIIGICSEYGLSTAKFLFSRLLQLILCPAVTFLLILIYPESAPAFFQILRPYYMNHLSNPFSNMIFAVLSIFSILFAFFLLYVISFFARNKSHSKIFAKKVQKP